MSEKFNLAWNDFHSNASSSFSLFRNESYLHDVTLVSDDLKRIEAHKLVLSSCSEYFQTIFKETKKEQPLLCLDGINSDDLKNVLDYAYDGVVKIFQEDLDRFLTIAQRLKLKGLMENDQIEDLIEEDQMQPTEDVLMTEENEHDQRSVPKVGIKQRTNNKITRPQNNTVVALPENTEHKEYLAEQVISNPDKSVTCKICGKTTKPNCKDMGNARRDMKRHVETHIEGLSYTCPTCSKVFRSENSLNTNKSKIKCG